MLFNEYIWNLYKTSSNGKEAIEWAKPFQEIPNSEEFFVDFENQELNQIKHLGLTEYIYNDRVNLVKIYHHYFKDKYFSVELAEDIINSWIDEGITFGGFEFVKSRDYERWMSEIQYLSNALYVAFPSFFFPYFFEHNFDRFQAICEDCTIILPKIPKKSDKKERLSYYAAICRAIYEFRLSNSLTPEECVAFLYDFVPNSMPQRESDDKLSEPSKIWYVGAGGTDYNFLDTAANNDTTHWQCNVDTKAGDIIVMYCWSPRSHIHSIWRATTNGFIDPFFYYYTIAYIRDPIRVPAITFKEIKNNLILSKNPIVANNFQGVNGCSIEHEEYQEMLRLWQEKGMNVTALPTTKLTKYIPEGVVLNDERDVEIHLVENLLKKLKFTEKDWVRQMPVKMGRGTRYYPDYCLGVVTKRGEESANILIEAKYTIKNSKNLQDAYLQAKSYAIRLQANKFIIASKEGIWLYVKGKTYFDSEKYHSYTWNDLEHPDKLHELSKNIGKVLRIGTY